MLAAKIPPALIYPCPVKIKAYPPPCATGSSPRPLCDALRWLESSLARVLCLPLCQSGFHLGPRLASNISPMILALHIPNRIPSQMQSTDPSRRSELPALLFSPRPTHTTRTSVLCVSVCVSVGLCWSVCSFVVCG